MEESLSLPPPDTGAPAAAAAERSYYSISEAAALLGVSRVSVWRWIRAGRLPALRVGHRTVRIRREDLERVLAEIGSRGSQGWVVRHLEAEARLENGAKDEHAPRAAWREMRPDEHFVQFYETDAFLLDAVGDFICAALREGGSGIVLATEAHRAGLDERLEASGLDVAAARAGGRYVSLDAAEMLARFMVDGAPDRGRFMEVVGGLIERVMKGGGPVHVFGEMVSLLALEKRQAAAIRLEEFWNDLQKTHCFPLCCGYPMDELVDRLGGEALAELLGDVCAEHSRVIPAESYTALPTPAERLRAVALLQQKARWLEGEIGERKRAEDQLQVALDAERAAREEAESALRVRDEFLLIAAHELKTPLTALSGQAQLFLRRLMREGQVEPERAVQAMETITGQANKLSRLLSQLLDISRLEAAKLTLEVRSTDLAVLVEQVVSGVRARSDGRTISLQGPACLEAQVDPLRLEQVLTNLLDNAIKYSPESSPIEVVLSRTRDEAVELSVRDHGLGIPPEKRGQVFERFYQAHGNGHMSGLGLGLFISRQIVELHGGEIRAEFPSDGGTRFVVRLPIGMDTPTGTRTDTQVGTDHSSAA